MTQGERVKAVRKTLGLSLSKFGAKLSVEDADVYSIESGLSSLTE